MDTFLRVEKKYRMNEAQYKAFMERIKEHMNMDEYGKHAISNLYYDTPSRDMIRRSLDNPVFKEKLRLRAYGKVTDQDTVFVELKRKYDGMVYKRRCAMTNQDAMRFLNEGIKPQSRNLIFKEIEKCIERHPVEPSFMIAYDRIAMYGKEDNELRLTIDANLRSRTWDRTNTSDPIVPPCERNTKKPMKIFLHWLYILLEELLSGSSSFFIPCIPILLHCQ